MIPRQDVQDNKLRMNNPLSTLTSKHSNDFVNSTWKIVLRRRMMMPRVEF